MCMLIRGNYILGLNDREELSEFNGWITLPVQVLKAILVHGTSITYNIFKFKNCLTVTVHFFVSVWNN